MSVEGDGGPEYLGKSDKPFGPVSRAHRFLSFSLSRFRVYVYFTRFIPCRDFSFVPVCSNVKHCFLSVSFFFLCEKQRAAFTNFFPCIAAIFSYMRVYVCVCFCVSMSLRDELVCSRTYNTCVCVWMMLRARVMLRRFLIFDIPCVSARVCVCVFFFLF